MQGAARRSAHWRVCTGPQVDEHRLARRHVALEPVAGAFQRHRFAGHHHLGAIGAIAHAQRADAVGIAEGQQAVAGDQRDHRVRALACAGARGHGGKHLVGVSGSPARARSSSCASTLSSTSVSLSVLMWRRSVEQLGLQRVRVGQVAVVHQHDAEGRVDVEGLRLFLAVGIAGRRVAHLAQAAVARAARACCACGTRRAPCPWPCA
jgi:hypothetical protein